ncbi:flagellar hook-length control protein FliK [Arsukibacterium sp.]|uniref:flagellar hook-length control protein FliK n=1 Tax=Arsukibacterium sp. TaxID=1977258 RepID=UPI002FD8BF8E
MTDGLHFSFLLTGSDGAATRPQTHLEAVASEVEFSRLYAEQQGNGQVKLQPTQARQEFAATAVKDAKMVTEQADPVSTADLADQALLRAQSAKAETEKSEAKASTQDKTSANPQLLLRLEAGQLLSQGNEADAVKAEHQLMQPAQLWLGLLANATDQRNQLDAKALQAQLKVSLLSEGGLEQRISPPDLDENALLSDLALVEAANNELTELLKKPDTKAASAESATAQPALKPGGIDKSAVHDPAAEIQSADMKAMFKKSQQQQVSVQQLTRPDDKPFDIEQNNLSSPLAAKGAADTSPTLVDALADNASKLTETKMTTAVELQPGLISEHTPDLGKASLVVSAEAKNSNPLMSPSLNSASAKDEVLSTMAQPSSATDTTLISSTKAENPQAATMLASEQTEMDPKPSSAEQPVTSSTDTVKNQSLNTLVNSNVPSTVTGPQEAPVKSLSGVKRASAMQLGRFSAQSVGQNERPASKKATAESLSAKTNSGTLDMAASLTLVGNERAVTVNRLDVTLQPSAFFLPASNSPVTDLAQASERLLGSPAQQAANQLQANQLQSTVQSTVKQQLAQLKQVNLLHQEAAGQLRERVSLMMRQQIQVAEIRLDPAELGQMQIRVNMQQAEATVQFIVQQQHAKELLEQQMPRLREMLQQQGITLGEGQVQQDQGRQATQSGQHPEQQMAEESDDSFAGAQSVTVQHSDRIVDYYA